MKKSLLWKVKFVPEPRKEGDHPIATLNATRRSQQVVAGTIEDALATVRDEYPGADILKVRLVGEVWVSDKRELTELSSAARKKYRDELQFEEGYARSGGYGSSEGEQ